MEKVGWYVKPFRCSTGVWQTDAQTDGWRDRNFISISSI